MDSVFRHIRDGFRYIEREVGISWWGFLFYLVVAWATFTMMSHGLLR